MSYPYEPELIEKEDIDKRCWLSIDAAHPEVPCNRPAPNGAGICDFHLEQMREKGK